MIDARYELLEQAISRNAPAVLSLPSSGMLRHHRTRFLCTGEGGFYVESVPAEAALIDSLIISQAKVGVAFKSTPNKVVFAVPIWKRQPEFRINQSLAVEALLLPFPASMKSVQRRASYRVQVPSDSELLVRVWRIPEHAILRDRPSATFEVPICLRDISIGGMCVLLRSGAQGPPTLAADQRLRVLLQHGQHEAILEGRVRHVRKTPDGSARLGVQFTDLQNDIQGRHVLSRLTHIVGILQREEVRRARLGLTA